MANVCGIIVKILLLLVVLLLMFIVGVTSMGLYKGDKEMRGASTSISALGLFNKKVESHEDDLSINGAKKIRVDKSSLGVEPWKDSKHNPVTVFEDLGCDDLAQKWQALQATFCIGLIMALASLVLVLTLFCCSNPGAVMGCILITVDVLMLIFLVVFLVLVIVVKKNSYTCEMTADDMYKLAVREEPEKFVRLSETQVQAVKAKLEQSLASTGGVLRDEIDFNRASYSYAVYLTGVSCGLALAALCVGIWAKSTSSSANKRKGSNEYQMQPV